MRAAAALVTTLLLALPATAGDVPTAPNGIELVRGWEDWKVVAPSYRPDKEQVRVILGNDKALAALKAGTRPFPDGVILAKAAWTTRKHEAFAGAVEPDRFVQVEFMIKDARRYADTLGWGFARFVGPGLKPYGDGKSFAQECVGCHVPVAANDFVFTSLAPRPR
jgi:Cytochrome P460